MLRFLSRVLWPFGKKRKGKKGSKASRRPNSDGMSMPEDTQSPNGPVDGDDGLEDFESLADLEDMVVTSQASKEKAELAAAPEPRPSLPEPDVQREVQGTPERRDLIRKALAVQRKAQQDVFRELRPEEREKLHVMAMKTLVDRDYGEAKPKTGQRRKQDQGTKNR